MRDLTSIYITNNNLNTLQQRFRLNQKETLLYPTIILDNIRILCRISYVRHKHHTRGLNAKKFAKPAPRRL